VLFFSGVYRLPGLRCACCLSESAPITFAQDLDADEHCTHDTHEPARLAGILDAGVLGELVGAVFDRLGATARRQRFRRLDRSIYNRDAFNATTTRDISIATGRQSSA
jgi:hypothetical protein